LYIAKFPSRKDDYDVGLWEHFCHLLAAKAGIRVASTRVLVTENKYHTLPFLYFLHHQRHKEHFQ